LKHRFSHDWQAAGRIRVVPAGGVTESNIARILRETGVRNSFYLDRSSVLAFIAFGYFALVVQLM
jgi:copper homeostasis protein CutC